MFYSWLTFPYYLFPSRIRSFLYRSSFCEVFCGPFVLYLVFHLFSLHLPLPQLFTFLCFVLLFPSCFSPFFLPKPPWSSSQPPLQHLTSEADPASTEQLVRGFYCLLTAPAQQVLCPLRAPPKEKQSSIPSI